MIVYVDHQQQHIWRQSRLPDLSDERPMTRIREEDGDGAGEGLYVPPFSILLQQPNKSHLLLKVILQYNIHLRNIQCQCNKCNTGATC